MLFAAALVACIPLLSHAKDVNHKPNRDAIQATATSAQMRQKFLAFIVTDIMLVACKFDDSKETAKAQLLGESYTPMNATMNLEVKLDRAVLNDDVELAKSLISEGVNINKNNDDGLQPPYYCPLYMAILLNNTAMTNLLLDNGAHPNISYQEIDGATPLHIAAIFDNISIVSKLLEKGAHINAKNMYGYTALDYAKEAHNSDIIHFLKSRGAR
jgi:ankyrin repeat protein